MNLNHVAATLGRACGFGAATGLAAGCLLGTIALPGLGSVFGAWTGAMTGGFAGVLTGAALLLTRRPATARRVGALVSGLLAAAAMIVFAWGWVGPTLAVRSLRALLPLVVVGAAAAVGGITAPLALGGVAPDSAWRGCQRLFRFGALGGFCGGAVVGLVVGAVTYPPTAFFAGVEVGIFGTAIGLVLAVIVAGATYLRRLRPRDPRPR